MFKVPSDQRNANQNDSTLHHSEWLISKPQVITHIGEDEKKEEHSSIAGGIVKWDNRAEIGSEGSP